MRNLTHADSLFEKKMFIESYDIYTRIWNSGAYTDQMLLKMAFINEGLGNYTMALYYLDIYYSITKKRAVLQKMDYLAARYNLSGYEYTDWSFFLSLYAQYEYHIMYAVLALLLIYMIYSSFLPEKRRRRSFIVVTMISSVLFVFYTFDLSPDEAIVSNDALLMSAPSAGAQVRGNIKKGNKITVRSYHDIWCAIRVNGKRYYVRNSNLLFTDVFRSKKRFVYF
ncbi:MAG: hypothetical protein NZ529_03290 [Cytophagaceae bacterium]|nr:hypothetical protein [Cytophagaceae bacterium]MDW8455794.1 hypothetical protein [Cytophagaceae bacterium]